MPTRQVLLSEQFDEFISVRVAQGLYGDASEVVREGLRLLQQREAEDRAKIEWLRGAIGEGTAAVERGDYTVLETPEDIDTMMDSIRRENRADAGVGATRV